jgi:hypothetical protein
MAAGSRAGAVKRECHVIEVERFSTVAGVDLPLNYEIELAGTSPGNSRRTLHAPKETA